MTAAILGKIATLLIFGAWGWSLARKRTRPCGLTTWLIPALAVLVGGGIGASTRLVSVFGFDILLSGALVAWGLGTLAALVLGALRPRAPRKA